MTKPLRSYKDEKQRKEVIKRRLDEKRGGLGYWAAVDATTPKRKKDKK